MILRRTIEYKITPLSLIWKGNDLKDWVGNGRVFNLNGEIEGVSHGRQYKFDAAIQSDNEVYTVVYEKFGTKGVLLKNGEVLREINRSYYLADVYEYPIAFIKIEEEYAIVHCPDEYNIIEVDNVETGVRITNTSNRKEPADYFHSRFRVNDANTKLLNTGWVWHPMDIIELFDLKMSLNDNDLFDNPTSIAEVNMVDVCSAEFLSNDLIVISLFKNSKKPKHEVGLFSIEMDKFIKKVDVGFQLGTLVPIDENYVIDLYEHPKLIDLNTGEVKQRFEDINSGNQTSSIKSDNLVPLAFDKGNQRLAIGNGNKIELLEFEKTV